jgi:phage shock protein E
MNWIVPLIVGAVIVIFFLLKRMSFVTEETAREHLATGALVIDVRSPEEFRSGKVPGAVNLPLGEVREKISARVKDKNQPLLVHCLSGGRSAIAKQQLQALGYTKVFNLGSLARAQHLYAEAQQQRVTAKSGSDGKQS